MNLFPGRDFPAFGHASINLLLERREERRESSEVEINGGRVIAMTGRLGRRWRCWEPA